MILSVVCQTQSRETIEIRHSHDGKAGVALSNFKGSKRLRTRISIDPRDCVLEIFGMRNIIEGSTCSKGAMPTLIDVILTYSPRRVSATLNVDIGISDFHNLIAAGQK